MSLLTLPSRSIWEEGDEYTNRLRKNKWQWIIKSVKIETIKNDNFVKSRNQTAKKKDPDARHANPEEWGVHRSTLQWFTLLNIFFVWCYCFQAVSISHISWYGCLQFNRAGDETERSPSALLRAVSMSNGRWTFYEAVKIRFYFISICGIRSSNWKAKPSMELGPEAICLIKARNNY